VLRVQDSRLGVRDRVRVEREGCGLRVTVYGFRVQGSGFRVQGSGLRLRVKG
jgi:hypothetical protein